MNVIKINLSNLSYFINFLFWIKGSLTPWVMSYSVMPTLSLHSQWLGFLFLCFYSLAKGRGVGCLSSVGWLQPIPICVVQTQASSFVNWSFSRGHSDHNFRPQPTSWWSFLGNWTQWERFLSLLSLWVSIFLPL